MKGVNIMGAAYSFQVRCGSIKMICKKCGGIMKKCTQQCRFNINGEKLIKCTCKRCGNIVYITEEINHD